MVTLFTPTPKVPDGPHDARVAAEIAGQPTLCRMMLPALVADLARPIADDPAPLLSTR